MSPADLEIAADTAEQFELALRELEAFAGAGLSGFFSLLHPRVASKQSLFFQSAAQIGVGLNEGPCDGKTGCAGLANHAAATGVDEKIVSIDHLR